MDLGVERRELVAVSEAAEQLGLSAQRVRALVADGSLDAFRVGSVLLLSADSVQRRGKSKRPGGRPWSPAMTWAVLRWLDHEKNALAALDSRDRWRLRQRLEAARDLQALGPRLARRAEVKRYQTHPSVPARLQAQGALSGRSAAPAYGLNLVDDGSAVDLYVAQRAVAGLQRRYRLVPASGAQANVILRAVPDEAWVLADRPVAPRAAVALDLMDSLDSRSRAAGHALAQRIWAKVGQ